MPDTILYDSAMRLFGDLVTQEVSAAAERGIWSDRLLRAVEEAGYPDVLAEGASGHGRGGDDPARGRSSCRAGEAAGKVAEIAHQVYGAIGFTHEHNLHRLTRCLWSWRDEFGTESHWSRELGRAVMAAGADVLWPMITAG